MNLNLTPLDAAIFGVYMLAVLALGVYAARKNNKTKRDYFLAGELTQIKCYRRGMVDEESANTLTHIHGYRRPDHEFISQTGVPGPHSRPL